MGVVMQRFVYIVHIADRHGILMSHMVHAQCSQGAQTYTLDVAKRGVNLPSPALFRHISFSCPLRYHESVQAKSMPSIHAMHAKSRSYNSKSVVDAAYLTQ